MEDQLAKLAADAVVLKEKGNKAFKAKKYDEALRLYHHAIELDVRNPALFLNRSMCYGAQGNWTLSRIDAQRAIELSPEHYTKAYCRLIKALIELKEYKEARRALIISKMKEETPDLLILERLLLARANLDLQPKASDFDPLEELGEGNFSRIYKAVNKFTKHVYAIKAIEKAQVQQIKRRHKNVYNEIMMEKKILSKLHHPNIVILYSTFHDATTLYYLLEYCDGGEVWSLLRFNGSPCPLPASMSRFYAAEVLNALEHMHGLGIVHRDLKPENVLLTASGHVKLIDFGTAKDLVDTSSNGPEFVGTAEYMSPEAVDNLPTGPSTDLWAFGCLVYQLFDGYSPFKAPSPYLSFLKIRRALMRPSKNVPEDVRELCELLLVKPTVERLRNATGRTMTECLRAVEVVETLSSKRKEEADEEKEEGGMVGSDEEEMALDDKKIQDEFGKGYRINDSGPPVFQSEIYRYTALRTNLKFFQLVEHDVLASRRTMDESLSAVDLQELGTGPALRVPRLSELALKATSKACLEAADFLWREDAEDLPAPEWAKRFSLLRLGLGSEQWLWIHQHLERTARLHEPRVYRMFFPSTADARCVRVVADVREYVGLSYKLQHEWRKPFFFVQIADPQLGMRKSIEEADGRGGSEWKSEYDNLKKAVAIVNKLRPRFVIVSGDLTQAKAGDEFYAQQVKDFRSLMSRVSETIPVLYVCGNHDVGDDATSVCLDEYTRRFGGDYYGFWYGGMRGLVINTVLIRVPQDQWSERAKEMMLWFEQELEQAKLCAQHVCIFVHHPFFLSHAGEPDDPMWTIPTIVREPLLKSMRHKKVRAVFAGHYHRNFTNLAFPRSTWPPKKENREGDGDDHEGENGVPTDEDYEGPAMVVTNSTAMSLDGTPVGLRIVEVYENDIIHQFHDLNEAPTSVQLRENTDSESVAMESLT